MGKRFATDSVRPPERVKAWQAAVHNACVPMTLFIDKDADRFSGEILSQDIKDLCLSLVQANRHIARHDKSQIARTEGDFLLISMQIAGEGYLEQDDRSTKVDAGEFVVYESGRQYQWSIPQGFKQLVARVPRHLLRHRLDSPERCTARAISCKTGLGKIAFDYFSSLFDQAETLAPGHSQMLLDSSVDFIAATLATQFDCQTGLRTNLQSLHLKQAYSFIDDHIKNPELGPEMIAHFMGISVRYLHHLFQTNETSVNRHILLKRLSGCARAMSHPRHANTSISAIAFDWGFNSSAHFSRVFRAEFGVSPREYKYAGNKHDFN